MDTLLYFIRFNFILSFYAQYSTKANGADREGISEGN